MNTGTYVCAVPTPASTKQIADAILADGQPDMVKALEAYKPEKYHTTVLYSRLHHPDLHALRYGRIEGTIVGVKMFDVRNDAEGPLCALVLEIDAPLLKMRHEWLRNAHGATHDFPDYTPHITVGYKIPTTINLEWECPNFLALRGKTIEYTHERVEPLKLDWEG